MEGDCRVEQGAGAAAAGRGLFRKPARLSPRGRTLSRCRGLFRGAVSSAPSPLPHRTGLAEFPHPALGVPVSQRHSRAWAGGCAALGDVPGIAFRRGGEIIETPPAPHRWTAYHSAVSERRVIQMDQRLWDYKHQVLANRHMPPWLLMLCVKCIEVALQARPKALWRAFLHPDPAVRYGMKWYTRIGKRVWLHEVANFIFRDRRVSNGPTLCDFWTAQPERAANDNMPVSSAVPIYSTIEGDTPRTIARSSLLRNSSML